MGKWNCRYGDMFCGSFGDLCDECKEDRRHERRKEQFREKREQDEAMADIVGKHPVATGLVALAMAAMVFAGTSSETSKKKRRH